MPEGVKLSGKKFAEGLEKIVSDAKFREALRTRPKEVLPEIGIEISDPERAKLVADRLLVGGTKAAAIDEPNSVLVVSSVEVAVTVITMACADKQVEIAVEEIQRANVVKLQEALARQR